MHGRMVTRILVIVAGVLTLVIGLVLSGVILDQAATSGTNTNIGSFSGAQALNDLIPLLYYAIIVLVAVGLMGIGAAGFAGRGPIGGVALPVGATMVAAVALPVAAPIAIPTAIAATAVYSACAWYGSRRTEQMQD